MADDFENRNKNKEPNRSINVTKPKSTLQSSNIDASRVSAYTLREQASLEKLKKQVGNLDQKDNRMSRLKTIIAIILILILLAIAIVFIVIIGRNSKTEEEKFDIRISMQIENKDQLLISADSGQTELRKIDPGDRIPLSAYIRNSLDIAGDIHSSEVQPQPIYVRFKITLILDYEDRSEVVVPTVPKGWYRYNEDEEKNYEGSGRVYEDDGFFYYVGSLSFMQEAELFNEILFDGNAIFCEDGGKYGQLQVRVESTHANITSISTIWPSAPYVWRVKMMNLVSGSDENVEENN